MNILVCVKQVPDVAEIKIDPITKTLIRAGVPSIVNTYDAYALEMAVRIKEKVKGTITVLTMGPEQAKNALKQCISVGADKAYLLSDRVFAGSDTLATSYILSSAIKKIQSDSEQFDLIFCGKQAIDGDTGQVGPEMAEALNYNLVTYATEAEVEDNQIKVKRESDEGYDIILGKLPAVVTVSKTPYEPRYATLKSKMAANKAIIPVITSTDIEIDKEKCGLKGSPTKVKSTFTPVKNKSCIMIQEQEVDESAQKLVQMLAEAKIV